MMMVCRARRTLLGKQGFRIAVDWRMGALAGLVERKDTFYAVHRFEVDQL